MINAMNLASRDIQGIFIGHEDAVKNKHERWADFIWPANPMIS
jgi:hypothetical protein